MNTKALKAIDALIERGVDPNLAAKLVLGDAEPVASSVAGPVASPKAERPVILPVGEGNIRCQHPTNPCKRADLRSTGPRSRRHGPKGHRPVR